MASPKPPAGPREGVEANHEPIVLACLCAILLLGEHLTLRRHCFFIPGTNPRRTFRDIAPPRNLIKTRVLSPSGTLNTVRAG